MPGDQTAGSGSDAVIKVNARIHDVGVGVAATNGRKVRMLFVHADEAPATASLPVLTAGPSVQSGGVDSDRGGNMSRGERGRRNGHKCLETHLCEFSLLADP